MSKYDDIMQDLNPRVIIEKTEIPHDNARANCTLQSSVVESHAEFENLLIAYVAHHSEAILGAAPPPEFCLAKAKGFLDSSMGFDNAFYNAISGAEGGMPNILNEVCNGFKQEAKQAYFGYILDRHIDPLSFQDTVEIMRELKQKIGGYSPEAFGYISPEQMAGQYRDILWRYIDSLTRYRNLWTY